jgi:hypothetical protein
VDTTGRGRDVVVGRSCATVVTVVAAAAGARGFATVVVGRSGAVVVVVGAGSDSGSGSLQLTTWSSVSLSQRSIPSKRVAAGFRSFTNYRLRILLACGGCNWDLLGSIPR